MPRPPRPWFRFYVEAVHDRKLRRLRPEYRWLFVVCLAAARQSPVAGQLLITEHDPMTLEDLVDFAAMPKQAVAAGMTALLMAGVLDLDTEKGVYFVPAWDARQYESDVSTDRVRRSRQRSNAATETVEGTPPETEADTDTSLVPPAATTVPAYLELAPNPEALNEVRDRFKRRADLV